MKPGRPAWRRFLAPRYWALWAGFGIMRLLLLLPYAWQLRLGRGVGALLYRLGRRRRHIAEINLALCFPDLDDAARERLLRAHFASLGMSVVETALCWWGDDDRLRSLCRYDGLEHLEAALARGKGVIVYVGHFTDIELGVRLLALAVPSLRVSFRRHNNPLFREIQTRAHRRFVADLVPNDDMRRLLRTLRAGHPLYYLPDQDYHGRLSAFVEFFGRPASTTTATTHICRRTGAAVVPMLPERLPDAEGYRLTIYPALDGFPGEDEVEDTQRLMSILEGQIRRIPEQYLWVHRRFKTPPPGGVSPYREGSLHLDET